MRIISWNIDSLNAALTSQSNRAILTRQVLNKIKEYDADIIAIQETKLSPNGPTNKHSEILKNELPEYDIVWRSSEPPARKGYAGTMFLYKTKYTPLIHFPKIDSPDTMDMEGRIISLEFEKFYITTVYTPNAGDQLKRLEQRQIWDKKYAEYLSELDKSKPVIAMGDFNVAHKEIDLAHPENNHYSAGFTDEERQGFSNLLDRGFIDSFRYLHGDVEGVYSWWAQRVKTSKINNSGWRIDYFLLSEKIKELISKSEVIDSGERQDHAPLLLELDSELA